MFYASYLSATYIAIVAIKQNSRLTEKSISLSPHWTPDIDLCDILNPLPVIEHADRVRWVAGAPVAVPVCPRHEDGDEAAGGGAEGGEDAAAAVALDGVEIKEED